MTRSTQALSGGKSQQFTIPTIDTIFQFYKPKPPLSKFVDSFWLYEGHGPERTIDRILPTGTFELAINLQQNELLFYDPERPETARAFRVRSFQERMGAASRPSPRKSCASSEFTSNRAALIRFSDFQRASSPTLTLIWKQSRDRRRAFCASGFVN